MGTAVRGAVWTEAVDVWTLSTGVAVWTGLAVGTSGDWVDFGGCVDRSGLCERVDCEQG